MAYNVHFSKGSQIAYTNLKTYDPGTLYFITDANAPAFYLGEQKLSSVTEVANLVSRCDSEDTEIDILKSALKGIDTTKEGEVLRVIQNLNSDLSDVVGDKNDLSTTTKTNIVAAINELFATVSQNKTDSIVTVEVDDSPNDNLLKQYTIKQGTEIKGIINIPKDLVVQSGRLVEIVQGDDVTTWVIKNDLGDEEIAERSASTIKKAGTYIELKIASQAQDEPIYINVNQLIDIYTAKPNATQVQLSVIGNEFSAAIIPQSITSTELATDSVITVKIADLNVTKAKLASDVQLSLEKADTAVQTISEGTTDYSILVDGNAVRVHGLGSAALQDDDYFDHAGEAAAVLGADGDTPATRTVYGAHAHATQALADAQTYTDNALTWGAIGGSETSEPTNDEDNEESGGSSTEPNTEPTEPENPGGGE